LGVFMKRRIGGIVLLAVLCAAGCAGKRLDQKFQGPGLFGQRVFVKVQPGMLQPEVRDKIGAPHRRSLNVSYKGKTYDEVWIYSSDPATVLYFKHGVLEAKDYQY